MKAFLSAGAAIVTSCSLLIPLSYGQPGSLDRTFNPGSGANNTALCAALQTNGQIVIGGNFTTFNNATRHYVARLNPDGSLDSSFDVGVGPNSSVSVLTVQDDGKILIGGSFDSINGLFYVGLARLRPDGSVDPTFTNMFSNATALGKQTDGSILVNAGYPASPPQSNCIVRLTEGGVLDPSFKHAFFTDGSASAFAFQSSGQAIVGGEFTEISGSPLGYLARLNTNGSLDTNFNAGIAGGSVSCLAITPQDQIVIGGSFSSVNGYSRVGVARLNADGSVDPTFNPGLGVSGLDLVEAIALEQDGKVFIGGMFTGFDGTNRLGLARLNKNGSLDLSFDPKISNGWATSLLSQPDGKLIVGGSAADFNGTQMNGIARLYTDSSPTNALQFLATGQYFGTFLQGVVSNTYRIEWTTNINTASLWTPLFNVTLQTNPQFVADPNPPQGQRFYRAIQVSP